MALGPGSWRVARGPACVSHWSSCEDMVCAMGVAVALLAPSPPVLQAICRDESPFVKDQKVEVPKPRGLLHMGPPADCSCSASFHCSHLSLLGDKAKGSTRPHLAPSASSPLLLLAWVFGALQWTLSFFAASMITGAQGKARFLPVHLPSLENKPMGLTLGIMNSKQD